MEGVRIRAPRRVRAVTAVGEQVVPPNTVRNVVFDLASENACLATEAHRGIDDETVAAHGLRAIGIAFHG